MSAVERLKSLLEDIGKYGSPEDFARFDGIEFVGTEFMGERRWGYNEMAVLRVDGELVGVIYYLETDGGIDSCDEWEFVPVEEVVTTTYKVKR